jgi:enterobactin synthetase component D
MAFVARCPNVRADVVFDLHLEHGRCVCVRLPDADAMLDAVAEEALAPEERAFAAKLVAMRRRSWVGGRVAMREALERAGLQAPAVLADGRGAPAMPEGVAGSISHTHAFAAALVLREQRGASARIGLDIERDEEGTIDVAPKVLTDDELDEIAGLRPPDRWREVLMRFSAKEAIYKALDPFVHRYVGFKEVAVTPLPGGNADVRLHLAENEGPFVAELRWLRIEGLALTTARVDFAEPLREDR